MVDEAVVDGVPTGVEINAGWVQSKKEELVRLGAFPHGAASTVSLRPIALVTATSVDKRGLP